MYLDYFLQGLERCGKSCRLRWTNYLRPNLKRGNFTKKEEDTIINLKFSWGNKWSKIATKLPRRTDNEIKNLWNNHLEKRLPHSHKTNIHKKQPKENSSTSALKAFSSTTSATTNLVNSPVPISIQSGVGNNKPEEVSNKPNDQVVRIENFNMEGIHGVNNKQEEVKNIVNDDKMSWSQSRKMIGWRIMSEPLAHDEILLQLGDRTFDD
ncbi:hypothetical protein ACFE04_025237 [Oxalis oulophora]